MARPHTTEAFKRIPEDNIGIGFRPGSQRKHNRLKGNRCQKSKHKMRTNMGMKNSK